MGSTLAENVGYLCTGYPLRRLMELSVVLGLPFGVCCMYAGYDARGRPATVGGELVDSGELDVSGDGHFGDIQALTGSSLPDQVLEVPPG